MAAANALFTQVDLNHDQQLDLNEFRNLAGADGARFGASGYNSATDLTAAGSAGSYESTSYQASSYGSSTGGDALGGDLAYVGTGPGSAGYGASSYGSSSYSSSTGNVGGDLGNVSGTAGFAATDSSTTSYGATTQTTNVQQYDTDTQGLFKDSNPQIIRRPAPSGDVTYTQNIRVRFLQPPPIPPPGPLIIKEVRPPQPPPPPPLRVRQQAPPLPQPPPLILRERPPTVPASATSQTVIRRLEALPVPPRSVIIERLPAAPAKPRDIIIERWIPYGAAAKRQTIVQRAAAAQSYATPRNIIIQYEAPQVRIVRQFQRLGVTPANPAEYVQRYGAALLESQSLLQQARAAGVVEDISPPAIGIATGSVAGLNTGVSGLEGASSSYSTISDTSGYGTGQEATSTFEGGFETTGLGGTSAYGSSSYSATNDVSGLATDFGAADTVGSGRGGASSYESSSSYSSSTGITSSGATDGAFAAADVNYDGVLSQGEFRAAGY